MKYFLQKVQSLSALRTTPMKYTQTKLGTKKVVFHIDEYEFNFIFNKRVNQYKVIVRTAYTKEIRFNDGGYLDSIEEVEHTFGSIAEIILILQLV